MQISGSSIILNYVKQKKRKSYDLGTSLGNPLEISTICIHIQMASISEEGENKAKVRCLPAGKLPCVWQPCQQGWPEEPSAPSQAAPPPLLTSWEDPAVPALWDEDPK